MAVGQPIVAGSRILSAAIAAIAPLCVIKAADQTIASQTTPQNDNALLLSLPVASATYIFVCVLDYEGDTQGSSDIKWTWAVPSGTTMRYTASYITTAGAQIATNLLTGGSTQAAGTNGSGQLRGALMIGSIVMSTTTGTLQFKWAQNTSDATGTIVHAQSLLAAWRIS